MRKTMLALALMMLLSAGVANAQYIRAYGYCEDGNQTVTTVGIVSTTVVQRSYPGCTINVYAPGTTNPATIYSDSVGTPKANPFTGSATGFWFFYAATGCYDVQLSGAGITAPFTLGDVCISSPQGNNTFNGNLIFNGTVTFNNLVTFNGPVTMLSSLDVSGSLSVGGDLDLAMATHIQWPNAFLYQGDEAHGQLMGIGDGTTVMFTGTVRHRPILPNSVDVLVNDVVVGSDDGAGNLSGATIAAGSIDYTTGAFTVTFTGAPADLIQVEITDIVEDNLILGTNSGTPQNAFVVIQNDLKISGPAPGRGLGALFAQLEFLSLVSGGGTPAAAPFVGAVQVYEKASDALGAKIIYYRDHALNEYQLCSVELGNCAGAAGAVTMVTATAPIVSTGGGTPDIRCPTCAIGPGPEGTGALLGTYHNTTCTSGQFGPFFANGTSAQAATFVFSPIAVGGFLRNNGLYVAASMGGVGAYASNRIARNVETISTAGIYNNMDQVALAMNATAGTTNFSASGTYLRLNQGEYVNSRCAGANLASGDVDTASAEFVTDNGSVLFGARPSAINACLAGETCYTAAFGNESTNAASEAVYQTVLPFDGQFQYLMAYNNTAQPASGSCVVSVRLNETTNTAVTFTIPLNGTANRWADLVNTAAFSAGDRFSFQSVNNAGVAACALLYYSLTAVPTTPTDRYIGGHVNTALGAGTTRYSLPMGTGVNATEARVEYPMPRGGTISDCYVRMGVANIGTSTTFTMRKNQASQAVTITLAAGVDQDSDLDPGHAFTVVKGDRVAAEFVQPAGGTPGTVASWSCKLTP